MNKMSELFTERLNRDFKSTDENNKLLSAYDKVIKEQYMLTEDATEDALKTLKAIIGSLKDDKKNEIYKMAMSMKSNYEKNKGFSKDQASWIYNTSKSLFSK